MNFFHLNRVNWAQRHAAFLFLICKNKIIAKIAEELSVKNTQVENAVKLIDEGNISEKEFQEKYLPFYDNFEEYMIRYVIPDAVAFYIANSYSRGCLDDSKLYNHINSAVDIFNCRCDIDVIIPSIEKILNIKYNLKITQRNPLKLEKYY